MEWKEEFQHGLIWQDFQHHQLIDNINALINSVTSGDSDDKSFRKAALFTIQYCSGHFKIEEEYMKKHGYSLTESHIEQHNLFIDDFKKIISDNNLNGAQKSSVLLNKLLTWFKDHILTDDKLFANFILRHEIE